jgi:hypothetical protein
MYIHYPQTGLFIRDLNNPLKYLDVVQEKLDISCLRIKNIPFYKKSRICRNIVINHMTELVHKHEIRGYFWGLMAARPLYYFYPLQSQLDGFYNCDFCDKKQFYFLHAQLTYLAKQFPAIDIKAFNQDIFEKLDKTKKNLPSIVEYDGMKTLDWEQIEKLKWLVREKLEKQNKVLLSVTSTIGRVKGFNQQFYEKQRKELIYDLNKIRPIIEHQSIEYAEQTRDHGSHYPMRIEIMIFDTVK